MCLTSINNCFIKLNSATLWMPHQKKKTCNEQVGKDGEAMGMGVQMSMIQIDGSINSKEEKYDSFILVMIENLCIISII